MLCLTFILCLPPAAQSSAVVIDVSEVDSTPLGVQVLLLKYT